jgi:hypothetical protein
MIASSACQMPGDSQGEGINPGSFGNTCAALGDACKAIDFYDWQLIIACEIGDRRGETNASWNLGLEYENSRDLTLAGEVMQIRVNFER